MRTPGFCPLLAVVLLACGNESDRTEEEPDATPATLQEVSEISAFAQLDLPPEIRSLLYHDRQAFAYETGNPKEWVYGPEALIKTERLLSDLTDASFDQPKAVAWFDMPTGYPPHWRLPTGKSCLILHRVKGNLKAYIQPVNGAKCPDELAGETEVRLRSSAQTPAATVRWVIPALGVVPGIGVRCGTHWCTVAMPGQPAPTPVMESSNGDSQPLAMPGPDRKVKPTLLFGQITPDPKLAENMPDYSKFDDAAHVQLSSTAPGHPTVQEALRAYETKWRLPANSLTLRSRVIMQLEQRGNDWFARFFADRTEGQEIRMKIDQSSDHHPPPKGVVRWFWKANDETVWVRCGDQCCEALL